MLITGQAIPMRSGVTLLARISGNAGVPITQATLASIQYALTDLGSPAGVNPVTGPLTALSIAGTVFDQLQQSDPRWTRDSAQAPGPDGNWGYNWATVLPAALFTSSSNRMHVDVVFTPVIGEPWRVSFEWNPLTTYA